MPCLRRPETWSKVVHLVTPLRTSEAIGAEKPLIGSAGVSFTEAAVKSRWYARRSRGSEAIRAEKPLTGSAGVEVAEILFKNAVNFVDFASYEAESFSKYLEVIKSRYGSAPLRSGARPLEAEKPLTRSAGVSYTEATVKSSR